MVDANVMLVLMVVVVNVGVNVGVNVEVVVGVDEDGVYNLKNEKKIEKSAQKKFCDFV